MDAIIDLLDELESINAEIALTAEHAWIPGHEPFGERESHAVTRSIKEMRAERNRLEEDLDRLIVRLQELPR